jgi:hypothetical protein
MLRVGHYGTNPEYLKTPSTKEEWLLASCDATYKFTFVDIEAYGSQSDGGVLRESVFGQRMEQDDMAVPKTDKITGTNIAMSYFLVADEAFPLKQYIMRPYPGKSLTNLQRIFNYRLSRARQVIENTFGILVARWRILKTTINAKIENVDNIVKALVVLHNYCQVELDKEKTNIYCPPGFVDSGEEQNGIWRQEATPLSSVGRMGANIARRQLYEMRNRLAEYLTSEAGSVPWQNNILQTRNNK